MKALLVFVCLGLIFASFSGVAQRAIDQHKIELEPLDSLLAVFRRANLTVLLSSDEATVGGDIRREGKPLGEFSITQKGLSTTVYRTDEGGVTWQVLDLDGDGIPNLRVAQDGPSKGSVQRLTGWKWESK